MFKNKLYKKYYPIKTKSELDKLLWKETEDFMTLYKTAIIKEREQRMRIKAEVDSFNKKEYRRNKSLTRPLFDALFVEETKCVYEYLDHIHDIRNKFISFISKRLSIS